jgi:hydroxyacylglutathione hydrolase
VNALDLEVRWAADARDQDAPAIQVHRASDSTVLLRQSIGISFEAPFLYLLFGRERALLLDTGATADEGAFPLRETVDTLIDEWLGKHSTAGYELVVAHTHPHSDHVAADAQFGGREHTTVVGHDADEVSDFFGIETWPTSIAWFDLGGREIAIIPIPGHHQSSIALWDSECGALLTGDTAYPGRLYVNDFASFQASLDRLLEFAGDHEVTAVFGAHIEQSTTPYRDFPIGSRRHPGEAALPLTVGQLRGIRDAAASLGAHPGAHRFDGFSIWTGTSRGARLSHHARLAAERITRRG